MASPGFQQLQEVLEEQWASLRSSLDHLQMRQRELISKAFDDVRTTPACLEVQEEILEVKEEQQIETTTKSTDLDQLEKEDDPDEVLRDWLSMPLQTGTYCYPLRSRLLHFLKWFSELEEPERRGCLASIVNSQLFENVCSVVICFNVVYMVLSADRMMILSTSGADIPEAEYIMNRAIETALVAFYTVELSLRIAVHKAFFFFGPSYGWHLFDMVLVLLSLQDMLTAWGEDISNFGFLRMFRSVKLAKILRVARVLKVFRELRLILISLVGSLKSLFWSIVMMTFIYLSFALLFVELIANYFQENLDIIGDLEKRSLMTHFGSVGAGMFTFFAGSTGSDWTVGYNSVGKVGAGVSFMYLFFVAFVNISFMNIVTGLFIEKALKLAQPDLEAEALMELQEENEWAHEMLRIAQGSVDKDFDGNLTKDELAQLLRHPDVRAKFSILGIGIKDVETFYDMLSAAGTTGGKVPIRSFVESCLKLRGSASSIDLQTLTFRVVTGENRAREYQEKFADLLERVWNVVSQPLRQSKEPLQLESAIMDQSQLAAATVNSVQKQVQTRGASLDKVLAQTLWEDANLDKVEERPQYSTV
eukprot:TRINITY_DN41797_c0_g1_i1.p1 TRINITY_DN41797_c0_g1~~TRINITY_DN41797_c0_g1_i1.p1  ORF type:complete len:590 (+),score=102.04 TRINITY_DN41797_c0_g1_i1:64-1833(+)